MRALYRSVLVVLLACLTTQAIAAEPVTGLAVSLPAVLVLAVAAGLLLALLLMPVLLAAGRQVGDRWADRRLRRTIAASGCRYLSDFVLPGACGGLTRIDHAVLAGGGIVCLMRRRYRGSIFGKTDGAQWMSVEGSERRQFMNPVMRNRACAEALANALPGVPVRSLVVFDDGAEFPGARPADVVLCRELAVRLDEIEFEACAVEDWDAVWLDLRAAALTDDASRRDLKAQLSFG